MTKKFYIHSIFTQNIKFISDSLRKLVLSFSTFLKFRYHIPIWQHYTPYMVNQFVESDIFRNERLIFQPSGLSLEIDIINWLNIFSTISH